MTFDYCELSDKQAAGESLTDRESRFFAALQDCICASSYSRMETIFRWRRELDAEDWYHLLGQEWDTCDNICDYQPALGSVLGTPTIHAMMTPEENAAYDALPAKVTIYRGCASRNVRGLSWSLDRDTAMSFPLLNRYGVPDPLLATAVVKKNNIIALKMGRHEHEVITCSVRRPGIEPIGEGDRERVLTARRAGIAQELISE